MNVERYQKRPLTGTATGNVQLPKFNRVTEKAHGGGAKPDLGTDTVFVTRQPLGPKTCCRPRDTTHPPTRQDKEMRTKEFREESPQFPCAHSFVQEFPSWCGVTRYRRTRELIDSRPAVITPVTFDHQEFGERHDIPIRAPSSICVGHPLTDLGRNTDLQVQARKSQSVLRPESVWDILSQIVCGGPHRFGAEH